MTGNTPRALAMGLERRPAPETDAEGFAGFAVLALPFTLGDVLAFRRVTASSIGPGCTSVWHRDRRGRWTVFVDGDPHRSCPRYYGAGLARTVRAGIGLEWTGPRSLAITVPDEQIDWAIRLEARASTRAWNGLARLIPRPVFRAPGPSVLLGALAGWMLGTPPLQLRGRVPNGQWLAMRPSRLWAATASAAVVGGRDLGPMGPHPDGVYLGDLRLPDRPLFMAGEWLYEPFDPERHQRVMVGAPDPGLRLRRRA